MFGIGMPELIILLFFIGVPIYVFKKLSKNKESQNQNYCPKDNIIDDIESDTTKNEFEHIALLLDRLELKPRNELELIHPEVMDAMSELEEMGASVAPKLSNRLKTAGEEAFLHIISLLTDIGHKNSIVSIAELTQSSNPRICLAALSALKTIDIRNISSDVVTQHIRNATEHNETVVSQRATQLLSEIRSDTANDTDASDTSLREATANNDLSLTKQLIYNGADVDDTEGSDYGSPLHEAAIIGNVEIAKNYSLMLAQTLT